MAFFILQDDIVEQEEAVRIFDLVVKEHLLPATLDKLVPMSFMGQAAVKFYQAKVKLMDQLGATEEQRRATLADGQDAGEMLLNIEARIGELLERKPNPSRLPKETRGSAITLADMGSTKDRSKKAQAIYHNPKAVEAIIKEARENDDIPTKTAVLNFIRVENMQKKMDERFEKKIKTEVRQENRGVADYFDALKELKTKLQYTIHGARDGWFSPESISLLGRKHGEIIDLMNELEEIVNEK